MLPGLVGTGFFGSAAALVPASRYWRINITANGGDASTSAIVELEMYESRFGPNVCTGVTATSSGNFDVQYPASEAFDQDLTDNGGGTSLLWASNSAVSWIRADFGASVTRSVVALGMHGRRNANKSQMPTAFDVQYSSDGTTWTTAWSESGVTWAANEFKRFYHPSLPAASHSGSPHGSHSYWRMAITNESVAAIAITEAELRATVGGADQATGGTPSASSIFSGSFPASYAFDNNTSTFWHSAALNYAWLQYQFASPVTVAQISIQARNSGSPVAGPEYIRVQYSDDGTLWTTTYHPAFQSGWSLSEVRTFTDPNYV